MKKNIKFSIVIPNYNKGEYIEECLNSIFNQKYQNFEIIVVDDGSTDNSLEIIKKYPVQLVVTDRLNAGGARNMGLKLCSGEYILFLDSDDYLSNDYVLEKLNKLITNEDLIFLNYTRDYYGQLNEIIEPIENISLKIEKSKNLGCPTKCFKKTLLNDIHFPERKRYEDIAFTIEAMCKAEKYVFFKESFFHYRKVENSNTTSEITGEVMTDLLEEFIKLYRFCFKYPKYKLNILNRIKRDRIPLRIEILDNLIETEQNTFKDFF